MTPVLVMTLLLAGEPVEAPGAAEAVQQQDPELVPERPAPTQPTPRASLKRAYGAAGVAALLGLPLAAGAAVAAVAAFPLAFGGALLLGLLAGPLAGGAVAGVATGGLLGAFAGLGTGTAAWAAWPGEPGGEQWVLVLTLALAHVAVVAPPAALVPLAAVAVPTFLVLSAMFVFAGDHGGGPEHYAIAKGSTVVAGMAAVVAVLALAGTVAAVVGGGAVTPALGAVLGRALTRSE